ncbi:MAG: ATP cone domain-containing protein [Gammaproteobacteria bacterium]
MAKTLVEDVEDNTKVPFLRGILIRSLQDAGLSFKEAYQLSAAIRGEINNLSSITTTELRRLVIEHLRRQKRNNVANRYAWHRSPLTFNIQVKQRDGSQRPFSRLEYQQGLETIGLESEEALEIVTTVYKHLNERYIDKIDSRHLGNLTYRYLRQSRKLGPAVAQRWLIWRDFVNSGRPLIFLIGGTAGCGKSTVASLLASHLDIVRTQSTDMLREVMRTMLPSQLLPVLHTSSFAAWSALPGQPKTYNGVPEALLINGYRTQADLLSVAIEAVIQRALRERVSLILEGVHIHPAFIRKLKIDKEAVVVPIMLGILKRKRLQRRISGRSTDVPQRRAERYLKHFDEIWHLQSYLLSEADRVNIPIIDNNDRDKIFREVMRITIEILARDFKHSPRAVFG